MGGVRFLQVVGMVYANVRAKITGADKLPVADITLVRLLARVGEYVGLQIARRCESLGTLLALVRSFAGVDSNVPS